MSDINNGYKGKDKVIDIQHHKEILERDPEMTSLLLKMRKVRERVPVNYDLKEELRQKFLKHEPPGKDNSTQGFISPTKSKFQEEAAKKEKRVQLFQWMLFLIPFTIVIAAILYSSAGDKSSIIDQPFQREEREIFSDSLGSKDFSVTIGSKGKLYFIFRGSLWEMKYNGQDSREVLAPETGMVFREAALSPDEKQLLLIAESGGKTSLFLMDLVIFNKELLLRSQAGETLGQPVWSPDGGQIIFTVGKKSGEDFNYGVYRLGFAEADKGLEFVTKGSYPALSPDGKQLAVQRYNDNNEAEIWIVGIEGESETLWGLGGQPRWSSKNQLAFVNDRRWEKILSYDSEGNPLLISEQRVQEIWVADLEGKVKINLTQLPGPGTEDESKLLRQWETMGLKDTVIWELRSTTKDNNPQWSPDGTFLIVERNHRNHSTLVWVRAGGESNE